jgi:hypothetical protein
MPRRFMPCELGSATRLLDCLNVANEGTLRRTSSIVFAGICSSSPREMTVTAAVASRRARASRVAVTTISSPNSCAAASGAALAGGAGFPGVAAVSAAAGASSAARAAPGSAQAARATASRTRRVFISGFPPWAGSPGARRPRPAARAR